MLTRLQGGFSAWWRVVFAGGLLALPVLAAAAADQDVIGIAARQGTEADQLADGMAAYQRGDYSTAMRLLRRLAAEQGIALAQLALGEMYASGRGAPLDYAEAATWFRKAGDQGFALAQQFLGVMYANWRGVPQDPAQAADWSRKAADQGDAQAQHDLAEMYANGLGVPRDFAQAATWFLKAADQGNASAQAKLGLMYLKGEGVPLDFAQAVNWSRKAADQGMPEDRPTSAWRTRRAKVSCRTTPRPPHGSVRRQTLEIPSRR